MRQQNIQYRVKKRIGGACLVCGVLLATAVVFICLDAMDAGIKIVNRSVWILLVLLSMMLAGRFISGEHVYQINDSGVFTRFEIFVTRFKRSDRVFFINLHGNENLYRYTGKNKKICRKAKNKGNFVSNMFPREKYCLVFEESGELRRIFIECDEYLYHALSAVFKNGDDDGSGEKRQ